MVETGAKISALDPLTSGASGDLLTILDISDNDTGAGAMSADGTNKKMTLANLVASLKSLGLPPAGIINAYGGATAPTGYLLCDGSAVSRTTYADLFTAIGTTWGVGDGTTTFNLPDLRGVFLKGAGTTNRVAGKDGADSYYSATLGSYSQDKLQGHRHNIVLNAADGAGSSNVTTSVATGSGSTKVVVSGGASFSLASIGDARSGGHGTLRQGNSTEPQNAGVNYIIKT